MVCQLFATVRRGNGINPLAKELGVDPNIVRRWRATTGWGAKGGLIPPQFNQAILEAADRRGIPREKLQGLLQDDVCPCCGQPIPMRGR